jgi:glycosyltransferase involved in cell wall biosynthesis
MSMARQLSRFDPDVVHIHTPLSIGVIGLLASRALRVPNVQTYHTYIPDFMQYVELSRLLKIDDLQDRIASSMFFSRAIESGAWQRIVKSRSLIEERADEVLGVLLGVTDEVAEDRPELTARVAWRFTRMLYNRANQVVTPSMTLKRELMRHGVTAPVNHISNGIDLDLVTRKESYASTGRILHAGRLGAEKNVEVVVKAFARVAASAPHATLDIAGDGPARKSLEGLVTKLGLGERVRFLGFMDRSQLAASYADYDCFATASTIETQGIVLLEAMAAGLPVVGVRALATPEIVRTGRDGIIVPPFDEQAMARAIERILAEQPLRERFGAACVADVQSHALERVVDDVEQLYALTAAEGV